MAKIAFPFAFEVLTMLRIIFSAVLLSFLSFGCSGSSQAQARTLQEMDDFHWIGQLANQKNIPIMIMFTAQGCEFCRQLKREVLNPMILGGLYDGYAMYMRQVSLDDYTPLKFSDEESIDKRAFARMYRAEITPTIIFVNSRGIPIAEKIVGVFDTQLFAARIHQAINQGYEQLGNPMELPTRPDDMTRPLPGFPE